MGLHLLKDLTEALSLTIDPDGPTRLTEADLPAVIAALEASAIPWRVGPRQSVQLQRLVRRYELYLVPLAEWLVIPLPRWIPDECAGREEEEASESEGSS